MSHHCLRKFVLCHFTALSKSSYHAPQLPSQIRHIMSLSCPLKFSLSCHLSVLSNFSYHFPSLASQIHLIMSPHCPVKFILMSLPFQISLIMLPHCPLKCLIMSIHCPLKCVLSCHFTVASTSSYHVIPLISPCRFIMSL